MRREDAWVLLSDGSMQNFYLGKTKFEQEEMAELMQRGSVVELYQCRLALTMIMPTGPGSIGMNTQVITLPLARNGATVCIKATICIWPENNPGMTEIIEKLVDGCERNEQKTMAQDAGILLAGADTIPPRRQ